MIKQMEALQEAAEIVGNARRSVAGGTSAVYRMVSRIEEYINKQAEDLLAELKG